MGVSALARWPRPIVGLTGGIGCGKSQAARFFNELGIKSVDADQIARQIVQPGEPTLAAIVVAFGAEALDAQGGLNRAWLRSVVFADPEQRRTLEALTHPAIRARLVEQMRGLRSPYGLLVTPLLFETDQQHLVCRKWVVDVPEAVQLARTSARDGVSAESIRAIMAAQSSRAERLAQADAVLDNSGDLAMLRAQVVRLHQAFLGTLDALS
jgi:dephospho-CoA kinase